MTISPSAHILGEKIRELIQNGIMIDKNTMHYIDSTYSNPSIEEFARILSDPSDCETETVFELMFYPDTHMQEKIEPILTAGSYSADDVESATRYLLQKKTAVPVTLPGRKGSFSVCPTDSSIRQLMLRLNITWQINARLDQALSSVVTDGPGNLRIRVLLRNCRILFPDPINAFLCLCIRKMYTDSPNFWEAFTFLLNFFEYTDLSQAIYHSLMNEKKMLLHNIDRAEKTEQALGKNSVEALMLKGMSILSINVADARKKIVLIDHICISIFGKTEPYGYANQSKSPVTVKNLNSDDFV